VRHALKYDSRNGDQLKRGGGKEIMGKEYKQDYRWRPKYSNKKPKQLQIILQYCNILKGNILRTILDLEI
jgi:hypothetical protein